jgi:hypothetical protein
MNGRAGESRRPRRVYLEADSRSTGINLIIEGALTKPV